MKTRNDRDMKKFLLSCLVFALSGILIGQVNNIRKDMENMIQLERVHYHQMINLKANPLTQNYDLKYHRLAWEVDPAVFYISGTITSYFIPTTANFNQVNFDLEDNMTVESVFYHGSPLSFTLINDNLLINLTDVISIGTLVLQLYIGVNP